MSQVETFEKLDGSELLLETVSVTRVLQFAAKTADGFARLLGDLWQRAPYTVDSPCHLVIFADAYEPGDVLRLDNKRKTLGVFSQFASLVHPFSSMSKPGCR